MSQLHPYLLALGLSWVQRVAIKKRALNTVIQQSSAEVILCSLLDSSHTCQLYLKWQLYDTAARCLLSLVDRLGSQRFLYGDKYVSSDNMLSI